MKKACSEYMYVECVVFSVENGNVTFNFVVIGLSTCNKFYLPYSIHINIIYTDHTVYTKIYMYHIYTYQHVLNFVHAGFLNLYLFCGSGQPI